MNTVKRHGLISTAIAFLVTGGLALWAPTQFEAGSQIPIHWGPDGADRFADASDAAIYAWMMPGAILLAGFLFTFMPFLDPFRANLDKSRKAYRAVWVSTAVLFCFIQFGFVMGMTGNITDQWEMVRWIMAAVSLMFVIAGNYLPKTRASFVFGIRTPWTLTSDTSWEKTHRLGGILFMLAGMLGIIGAFTLNGVELAIMLPAMLLPILFVLVVYSFLVWRKAEDRYVTSDYIV
ncbi:MAG: SdpI family protein [Pseudomonadota bacterium]